MTPSTRIAIGTFVFFLIIGAGFAAGFYFSFKKNQPSNGLTAYKETPARINNNTYDISPASIGAVIKTQPIPIQFTSGISMTPLPITEAASIKTGMKVILYDKTKKIQQVLGNVTSIGGTPSNMSDKVFVTIALMDMGIVPENIPVHGEIVIARDSSTARLPRESIVQDARGAPHVWEVHEEQDGTDIVYLKAINVLISVEKYVAIEIPYASTDLFVLNPDNALQDGQRINVRKMMYAGPEQTDDAIVTKSMEVFAAQRIAAALAAKKANEAATKPLAGGCGVPTNASQQFMDTVKALSPPKLPEPVPEMSVPLTSQ